jgi:thiamine biosynthesis protein ThiS
MTIILNGKPRPLTPGTTIAELLHQLHLDFRQVVVEKNAAIVSRQHYAEDLLNEGDRLEIVHFVGGG